MKYFLTMEFLRFLLYSRSRCLADFCDCREARLKDWVSGLILLLIGLLSRLRGDEGWFL